MGKIEAHCYLHIGLCPRRPLKHFLSKLILILSFPFLTMSSPSLVLSAAATSTTTSSASTVFADLISMLPTWSELKAFLTSTAGGSLSVYEVPDSALAMIRYVKGISNMDLDHTKAFRSVVWNTANNRPVSATAFKSHSDEGFPSVLGNVDDVVIEEFPDGVMIGQFWDETTSTWRIHTRSMLDAECRYFSATKTFATLFAEAVQRKFPEGGLEGLLEKGVSYTWILQHPENRVVCPVVFPSVVLVQATRISAEDGRIELVQDFSDALAATRPRQYFSQTKNMHAGRLDITGFLEFLGTTPATAAATDISGAAAAAAAVPSSHIPVDLFGVMSLVAGMSGSIRHQGVVIKVGSQPFLRWKVRSRMYNTVRMLRGNSARRDFRWMELWSLRTLEDYLGHFPEERGPAMDLLARWKAITAAVYKTYVDVFKARTFDKQSIPAKIRPLVYGLHSYYMNSLKPAGKSVDWRTAVHWMNDRDTAQKIYVLNWDIRQEKSSRLPIEPAATSMLVAQDISTA
jgi:hypothetical protein